MLGLLNKRGWLLLLIPISVIALGAALFQIFRPEEIPAIAVRRRDTLVTLTVTGEVRAENTVNVTVPFQARINRIAVDDGDPVARGQILVELDGDDLRAALGQARARQREAGEALDFLLQGSRREELAQLKAQVEEAREKVLSVRADAEQAGRFAGRLEPLYREGAVSSNEYDEAVSKRDQATAALRAAEFSRRQAEEALKKAETWPTHPETGQAKAALEAAGEGVRVAEAQWQDRFLRSPLDGLVLARLQDPGEIAQPGAPVLKIADRNTLEIVGDVEEADLARVAVGNHCYVILDAAPETALPGHLRKIGSEVNPENGTVEVEVDLDITDPKVAKTPLLPGMTADITLVTGRLAQAVVIPALSVQQDGKGLWVYTVRGDRVHRVAIRARRVSLESYQVFEGLQPGDWVVQTPATNLLEKGRVKAMPVADTSPDEKYRVSAPAGVPK